MYITCIQYFKYWLIKICNKKYKIVKIKNNWKSSTLLQNYHDLSYIYLYTIL